LHCIDAFIGFFPSFTDFSHESKHKDIVKTLDEGHHWLEAAPEAAGTNIFLEALRKCKPASVPTTGVPESDSDAQRLAETEMDRGRSPLDDELEALADELIHEVVRETVVDEIVHEIQTDIHEIVVDSLICDECVNEIDDGLGIVSPETLTAAQRPRIHIAITCPYPERCRPQQSTDSDPLVCRV
jgi:hypothetical protein